MLSTILARPKSWDRDRLAGSIGSSSSLLWTVFLPGQLVFAFQCHPPAMAQLVDKSIAIAEDIGIRDAKKTDVEPGAILLFLQIAGFLFFRLMDGAVDLNRRTFSARRKKSTIHRPLTTCCVSKRPRSTPSLSELRCPGSRRSAGGRMSAHPPCMSSDM